MNINLSNLVDENNKVYYFDGKINDHDLNRILENFEIISPIIYKGEIIKLEDSERIDINIEYKYKSECDRCLKNSINKVQTSLSATLKDYKDLSKEDNQDEDIIYHDNGKLELDKHIIMEVASSLPMKSLCKEDCKGICPQCGIDLNEESCDCTENLIDPRLEKLKEFNVKD